MGFLPPTDIKLRPFQLEDLALIRQHDYRALVANSPGTGKTIISSYCLRADFTKLTPTLVVCPSSVLTNWRREFRRVIPGLRVVVIKDTQTPIPPGRPVYVISWSLLTFRIMEVLRQIKPKFLIADEAHFAKNEESLRSKAIKLVSSRVKHMILLTGTPIVNTEDELRVLQELFNQPEPPLMTRRVLEDVAPDVPPKTRATLPVTLHPRAMAEYERAVKEFDVWLEEALRERMAQGEAEAAAQRALAAEALVKIGYLRRLSGRAKVPAAVDWASRAVRLGEPVVMFCEHSVVLHALVRGLRKQRIRCVVVQGNTTRRNRQKAIDAFQAGLVPVFIGTKAAKEGITLHRARHLCFVERYWTAADEEQAEDRIRRIGQKYPTKIWFLHAVNTVDDRLEEIVASKRQLVRSAIGSPDIASTPESAVLELIKSWSKHAEPTKRLPSRLGLGAPLPPLPSPSDVQTITFQGERWDEEGAKRWCKMMGYFSVNVVRSSDSVIVTNHPVHFFFPNTLVKHTIAKDIHCTVGRRHPDSVKTTKVTLPSRANVKAKTLRALGVDLKKIRVRKRA